MPRTGPTLSAIVALTACAAAVGAACSTPASGRVHAATVGHPTRPLAARTESAEATRCAPGAVVARGCPFVVERAGRVLRTYDSIAFYAAPEAEVAARVRAATVAAVVQVVGVYGVATDMGGAIALFEAVELVDGQGARAAVVGGHYHYGSRGVFEPGALFAAALDPLPRSSPCPAGGEQLAAALPRERSCVDAAILGAVPVASRVDGVAWLLRARARTPGASRRPPVNQPATHATFRR